MYNLIMIDASKTILWNKRRYLTASNVFSPKDSTLGIFKEIDEISFYLSGPILDLCCGIGAIGISAILDRPNIFDKFYGFDNDIESIEVCEKNIKLHKINGEAHLWEAGDSLPQLKKGIAFCNPPFLSKSDLVKDSLERKSLVYGGDKGLDVILKCFQSIKGTGHILILKSFKRQISKIVNEVGTDFILLHKVEHEIEKDYIIAFTTWKQK